MTFKLGSEKQEGDSPVKTLAFQADGTNSKCQVPEVGMGFTPGRNRKNVGAALAGGVGSRGGGRIQNGRQGRKKPLRLYLNDREYFRK